MNVSARVYLLLVMAKRPTARRNVRLFTAKYVELPEGYMGQLLEWPEVVTEGKTLEECREMLEDALDEMIEAYREQKKDIPRVSVPL